MLYCHHIAKLSLGGEGCWLRPASLRWDAGPAVLLESCFDFSSLWGGNVHGLLVLIIEDNRDISFILARVLEEAGFETEVVRSGDAALARLSTILPDVVVLDLNLPQVEGEDILGHIRSDPRLAATRVVISTAHTDLPRSIQDQADLVLAKPIDLDVLCDQVSHLVSCSS